MKPFITIVLVLISTVLSAVDNPYIPEKPGAWLNDYAKVFNQNEASQINKKFALYEDTTSTQIFLVTMNEHGDYPINMMAAEIGEKWNVGQKGKDNGIVILMYYQDREISIQVGYGLEEFIPDAIAKRIIEKEMKPHFINNDYLAGIDSGTDVMFGLLSGKFTGEEYLKQSGNSSEALGGIIFMMIIIFFIFGRSRRGRGTGIGRNVPFWVALTMLSGSRHSHSGSFGGFSSGSGGFGGFSGGGGGSFGGGGASGSW